MFDRVDVPFLIAAFASLLPSVTLWFLGERAARVGDTPLRRANQG